MRLFTKDTSRKFGGKFFAFTMAEILISLTIIGVIAAIVIPSLAGNIEKKTLVAKQKAFYSRMSQALALIDKDLNKYGQYSATYDEENSSLNVATDTGAMAFVTEALGQTIKINNVCDNENFKKCGVPDNITNMSGTKRSIPKTLSELWSAFTTTQHCNYAGIDLGQYIPVNTDAVAFETVNGESVVVYYNPKCQAYNNKFTHAYIMPRMCVNFVYDLNGRKGPNKIYQDVFILTMFGTENNVTVSPIVTSNSFGTNSYCKTIDNNSKVADLDETVAILINKDLITNLTGAYNSYGMAYGSYTIGLLNNGTIIKSYGGGTDPIGYCVKKK